MADPRKLPTRSEGEERARDLGARLLGFARAPRLPETGADDPVLDPESAELCEAVREFARADLARLQSRIERAEGRADSRLRALRERRRALGVLESSLEALLTGPESELEALTGGLASAAAEVPDWGFLAGQSPESEEDVERLRYRMAWLEARSEELEVQCRSALERSGLDPRTGLLSEGAFWARVEEETRRAYRSGHPVSAAGFFSESWLSLGENGEDDVLWRALSRAGRRARRELHRPGDVVGRSGSGILLLLPSTARGGARLVASRVQQALERDGDLGGERLALSCRGGTIWPRKGGTPSQLRALVEPPRPGSVALPRGSD